MGRGPYNWPTMPHASDPLPVRRGVARHDYLFAPTRYGVRDAVYGSVPLLPGAYATLDTRPMQRLHHIRQVPPAQLVYPGATHTRFSHSIGVYHLVRLALQHLTALADLEPEVGRAALAAGMLHDLGHLPNSHLMEEIAFSGTRLHHGELSVHLIATDPELRRVLAEGWDVDVALVTALLTGAEHPRIPPFVYRLVDGPMDMDKLDYLNRDAHHAGVPYGRVEVQRLIESLRVDPQSGRLVVAEEGIGTVESVVFAKYLMFRYVYWHHTARIASAMFNTAVADSLMALGVTALSVHHPLLARLALATDTTLEATLQGLLVEAGAAPPASFGLLARTEDRRLYKRVLTVPCTALAGVDALLRDTHLKRRLEGLLAEALTQAGLHLGAPLANHEVLVDVPPTAKFAIDFAGVQLDGDESRLVPWAEGPQPSYLNHAAVTTMESSIRFLQVVADPTRVDIRRSQAAAGVVRTALERGLAELV